MKKIVRRIAIAFAVVAAAAGIAVVPSTAHARDTGWGYSVHE